MKKNLIKMMLAAIVVVAGSMNVYNSQKDSEMSDVVLANVEALADIEYDGLCVEWVDKNCWQPDQFASTHGTDYYATCSGEPSTPGGKLECGALSSYEPLSPYLPGTCIQCVRTANGRI